MPATFGINFTNSTGFSHNKGGFFRRTRGVKGVRRAAPVIPAVVEMEMARKSWVRMKLKKKNRQAGISRSRKIQMFHRVLV